MEYRMITDHVLSSFRIHGAQVCQGCGAKQQVLTALGVLGEPGQGLHQPWIIRNDDIEQVNLETLMMFFTAVRRNNIISEIKKAPFLTIILDTTQDLSKIDQLSVVFRYISVIENDNNVPKEIKICESVLGFIAVTDCSAAGLKTVILNLTKEYGIDLTKCRQGYDGANVMSVIVYANVAESFTKEEAQIYMNPSRYSNREVKRSIADEAGDR
nr:unnamed protein product [Callosobruchus analis]